MFAQGYVIEKPFHWLSLQLFSFNCKHPILCNKSSIYLFTTNMRTSFVVSHSLDYYDCRRVIVYKGLKKKFEASLYKKECRIFTLVHVSKKEAISNMCCCCSSVVILVIHWVIIWFIGKDDEHLATHVGYVLFVKNYVEKVIESRVVN